MAPSKLMPLMPFWNSPYNWSIFTFTFFLLPVFLLYYIKILINFHLFESHLRIAFLTELWGGWATQLITGFIYFLMATPWTHMTMTRSGKASVDNSVLHHWRALPQKPHINALSISPEPAKVGYESCLLDITSLEIRILEPAHPRQCIYRCRAALLTANPRLFSLLIVQPSSHWSATLLNVPRLLHGLFSDEFSGSGALITSNVLILSSCSDQRLTMRDTGDVQ